MNDDICVDLDHYIDTLRQYGYVSIPYDRYFAMVMYCAVHGACGFNMNNDLSIEETASGRIN